MDKKKLNYIFYNPNESEKSKQKFEKMVVDILVKATIDKFIKDNDFKKQL